VEDSQLHLAELGVDVGVFLSPPFRARTRVSARWMPTSARGVRTSARGVHTHSSKADACISKGFAHTHRCVHGFRERPAHFPHVLHRCRTDSRIRMFLQVQSRVLNEARYKQHANRIVAY